MSNERAARRGCAIIANVERLNAIMDRAHLSAVVVRGGHNITYLSGVAYHGTLARHLDLAGSRRGVVVVWPREGRPVFVVEATAAGATERDSWIERLVVFNGYTESLFDRVVDVLKELGLERASVGFDKNYVGAGFWKIVALGLPNMNMADCTDLLDEVRWIKTDGEIEALCQGARLLDAAFAEVFPTIRPGEQETEVHGRLIGACLARGAEFAHGIFNSHRNPVIYCGESDFVLETGDIIRTDYLAYLNGYPGHQSRNAVLGPPTPQQADDYTRYYDLYRTTSEQLVPGVTAGEVYEGVVKQFARAGWDYKAGLVGHSVGPWWHQQEPIFRRGSRIPLQAGMVVAFEPYREHWHCQDLFRITDGAPELLSPDFDTSRMFVIY